MPMPAVSQWLKAGLKGAFAGVGVDREKNAVMGYVVAQTGPFREPDPRGQFNTDSLGKIVALMAAKPNGTKVRFGHPSLSDDAIGSYLGRALKPRLDRVRVMRDGREVTLQAVRADLYLSDSAGPGNPRGDLREYVLGLAEEDPSALASSLVLQVDEQLCLDAKGKPVEDEQGNPLPPLWMPTVIHASDLTDEGAATDGLLSAGIDVDRLPDALQRRGAELLDRMFAGADRAVIEARCSAWLGRYLDARFGGSQPLGPTPVLDGLRLRLEQMGLTARKLSSKNTG